MIFLRACHSEGILECWVEAARGTDRSGRSQQHQPSFLPEWQTQTLREIQTRNA